MTHNFTMPFSGGQIDHAETQRTSDEIKGFFNTPLARCLCFYDGMPALNDDGTLKSVHPTDLSQLGLNDPGPIFLGLDGKIPIFAASLTRAEDIADLDTFQNMRALASQLSAQNLAVAGRAKSLLDWHINHRFCAKCGQASQPAQGGIKRNCLNCETEHFPRVNPVVIMLILSGDKVLLGRGIGWPEGWMSALAGFVSLGETLEETVVRETFEEVGITIANPTYIFSQAWPFPSQLMMGVFCEAQNEDITLNKAELDEAAWYSKADVRAVFAKESELFRRPPRVTIAHQLLRRWLDS